MNLTTEQHQMLLDALNMKIKSTERQQKQHPQFSQVFLAIIVELKELETKVRTALLAPPTKAK